MILRRICDNLMQSFVALAQLCVDLCLGVLLIQNDAVIIENNVQKLESKRKLQINEASLLIFNILE